MIAAGTVKLTRTARFSPLEAERPRSFSRRRSPYPTGGTPAFEAAGDEPKAFVQAVNRLFWPSIALVSGLSGIQPATPSYVRLEERHSTLTSLTYLLRKVFRQDIEI